MFPSVKGMGAGRRMGAAFLCVCPVYNHSGKKKNGMPNLPAYQSIYRAALSRFFLDMWLFAECFFVNVNLNKCYSK